MVKFCRNCGKEVGTQPQTTCPHCGVNPVKATAFCRYCGRTTNVQDVTCPTCGATIKPLPGNLRNLWGNNRLTRWGRRVNLTLISIAIALYVIFVLPPSITKPIEATTADVVLSSVGYSAFPLNSISVIPPRIPRSNPENTIRAFREGAIFHNPDYIPIFEPNDTVQLTVTALYRNAAANNASGGGRLEEVTSNCSYRSNNENVATVTPGGLVQAVAVGSTTIAVSYTAAPGSANLSESRSVGKIPITVNTTVNVIVTKLPVSLGGKP